MSRRAACRNAATVDESSSMYFDDDVGNWHNDSPVLGRTPRTQQKYLSAVVPYVPPCNNHCVSLEHADEVERHIPIIKYARFSISPLNQQAGKNPRRPIPTRLWFSFDQLMIQLDYESVIMENDKSLVCKFSNRTTSAADLFPQHVVVKFHLKYTGQEWCRSTKEHIVKRYADPTKGDLVCGNEVNFGDHICKYYGCFLLNAHPGLKFSSHVPANVRVNKHEDDGKLFVERSGLPASYYNYFGVTVVQVFEYIPGSDLYNYLCHVLTKRTLSCALVHLREVPLCLKYLGDACKGLQSLHAKKIYHCDIKPENIVINKRLQLAKLIDMDFCTKTNVPRLKRGTLRYLSPEYVVAYRGDADIVSLSSKGREYDMWAIGCVLWTILYGDSTKFCFTQYSADELKAKHVSNRHIQALLSRKEWDKFVKRRCRDSSEYRKGSPEVESIKEQIHELLLQLVAFDPEDRPTAKVTADRLYEYSRTLNKVMFSRNTVNSPAASSRKGRW